MSGVLADLIRASPRLSSPATAKRRLASLMREAGAAPLAEFLARALLRDLALGLADHSPYLWGLVTEDPARLARLLGAPPQLSLDRLVADMAGRRDESEGDLMRALRLAKRESALLIALADIGGVWDLVEVTEALSRFADAAVSCALRFLLRENAAAARLAIDADEADPERGSGLVVLALGKHGARELNYSSDVDLIVLFDPQARAIPEGVEPGPLFVRVTKALARLLQERTGEGYVLRVDLRLRPDPAATAVALSIPSAYSYYETLGQNWERAAMIKARPVAGDKAIGERFLRELSPFIWRKYFDYAAIADIHAMKRQIHAFRGHEQVTVPGHDIKLGRGGIREVEFFVQTQQLIFGGRRQRMRGARTLDMLAELHADGWVSAEAVKELSEAYEFLRRVEHRLQMVADEQTQRLPFEALELTRFAKFCGYNSLSRFSDDVVKHLRDVETHYARLFEHAPGLDVSAGSLVFTGVVDDPETLTTLQRLGFRRPEQAAETIRGWHFGRRLAVRGARAREVLTELTPALLDAFSRSGDPDAALAALDAALGRMTAAVELFSILRSNAELRELFGDILGSAPRLANVIATRPHVLDGAIDPARATLIAEGLDESLVARRIAAYVASAATIEGVLDRARDFAAEEMFLIGVRLLSGVLDPDQTGRAYSALAQGITGVLLTHVMAAFALEYGHLPGGRVAVLALGKLGSREMTAASDLDLILIYDFAEDGESDGPRRLGAGQYYSRLTQRLLAALTAPTKAGRLYEVDLRLRPSGRKGPVATQFAGFVQYQRDGAETWEHMALTRARVIAGDAELAGEIEGAIAATLCARRARAALAKDVRDMRALIAREKGDADPWDLKLVSGGLLDIEFIAQFLVLACAYDRPAIRDVSTRAVLVKAGAAGLLTPAQAEALTNAHRLFTDTTQIMRLAVDGPFDPALAAGGVKRRIAAAAALPDFDALAGAIVEAREKAREVFRDVLGTGKRR
ncbi:bifunctional [glutamine synthetase] adenylyltransferase/[glutamine synthetase]-adenylyl-L-tyrosine phosphorylase [Methylocapsa sp. S129]|uniref:bifunctional [glutamine synthetase] adenylyltransferase/[glutamine synthetase]-adenylyl-L-tyrosine phosphorylase n=1 Tax=Methylocapsa sp. S129 TaxID=1641869 RepID=UPI00131C4B3F|nr:bifunctional [glutamine synthetase] adenylyltransferase/[glutamine synthetase]-adenylyl-L-tyrosine phosphorylase [Methylocapsa sp. S129]